MAKQPKLDDQIAPGTGNEGAVIEAAEAGGASAAEAPTPTPDVSGDHNSLAPTVIVRGPAKGRWRAGRHFAAEPVSIALADLTADQVSALQTDPELVVQLVIAPH